MSDRERVESVRNVVLGAILRTPMGQEMFTQSAIGRHDIERLVLVVVEADRMFAEWNESAAFRDRFVLGMTRRMCDQLAQVDEAIEKARLAAETLMPKEVAKVLAELELAEKEMSQE